MSTERNYNKVFYSIRFFLNMSIGKEPGYAMIMLAIPHTKAKDLESEMGGNDFLVIDKNENQEHNDLSIRLFRDGALLREYDLDDVIRGNIYISSSPLRDDIWTLDKETQKITIEHIKLLESAYLVGQKTVPVTDINRLSVIIDDYTFMEEKSNKRYFAQIQNIVYIDNAARAE